MAYMLTTEPKDFEMSLLTGVTADVPINEKAALSSSIIICTKNRPDDLLACIRSIAERTIDIYKRAK